MNFFWYIVLATMVYLLLLFTRFLCTNLKTEGRSERWFSTEQDGPMSFKQFVDWMNDRACDGCWGMQMAMLCIDIHKSIEKESEKNQESIWAEFRDANPNFVLEIEEINKRIQSMEVN